MPALPIDLKPFGMNWFFDPINKIIVPKDYLARLSKFAMGKKEDGNIEIFSNGGEPSFLTKGVMGKGTFGTVYLADRSDGVEMVMKIIEPGVSIPGNLKEAIIQHVIFDLTKGIAHPEIGLYGPYAPALYQVGYIENTKQLFIASERLRATTKAMLETRVKHPDMLRKDCPQMLIQIATILEDLYVLCEFNHRDMKSDNCMYIRDQAGNMQVRLIDFGMSCMKYGDYEITGSTMDFMYCSLKTRDMTQLIFELQRFHKYMPADLMEVFEALLTFKRGASLCKMYEDCVGQKSWKDTYSYLNTEDPNPNCSPLVVINVMTAYKAGSNWRVHLDFVPGATVKKTSPKVTAKKAESAAKSAPKGKLYNPETDRFVDANGKKGQELLADLKNKKVSAEAIGLKSCPKDRPDFNPFTRRCVSSCDKGFKRNATFKCAKTA